MPQATQAILDARVELDAGAPETGAPVARVASRTDVRLSIHEDIAAIEAEWQAFEQHADGTIFQTVEWLATWQRHIGALKSVAPVIVAGRDPGGELLFLLPLAIDPTGGVRRLTWLGSELCDYNAPMLAPDFSQRVDRERFLELWRQVELMLQSHPRLRYDLIDLQKMPDTVGAQPNPLIQLRVAPHCDNAFVAHLGDNWEKYFAARRSSATRRHDRNRRKQLSERGELRFISAQDQNQSASNLDELIAQKTTWFARMGIANMFERPGYRDFFVDIATSAQTRQFVHLARLAVGSKTVATNFGLTFRDRYYHVIAGYDAGELSAFGPGTTHLNELLRHAISEGYRTFDFSIGEERYKLEWSDTTLTLHDHVSVATLRGAIAAVPLLARRHMKYWIKRKPALWQAVRKARSFVGSLFKVRG